MTSGLWRPNHATTTPTTWSKRKNVPYKGDITFILGFSLCKSEIKVNCLILLCKKGKD
jgi:hypothetical protein